MELFQNESACQTPLDRQYHTEVKALNKAKGRRNKRIFTYTDHDRYTSCLALQQLVGYTVTPMSTQSSSSLRYNVIITDIFHIFLGFFHKLLTLYVVRLTRKNVFVSSFLLFLILKADFQWLTEHNQIQPHIPGWKDGQRATQTARQTHHVSEADSQPTLSCMWKCSLHICKMHMFRFSLLN